MTRSLRFIALVLLLSACRTSAMDRGPLRKGDDALAREPITPAFLRDGDPPPPPIDTLSMLRMSAFEAPAPAGVVAPARATPASPGTRIRSRYYLRVDGTRGWIAFPQENQPPGVTVDSVARIIIRDGRIGGAGTITIRRAQGTLVIDLSKHLRGIGTEISGRCGPRLPGRGSCATLNFEDVPFTPTVGMPTLQVVTLEIGVP